MASDRARFRGTILVEDRRTERFLRELLDHLGFDRLRLNFRTAPKGKGDASAWVRAQSQYPAEVRLLRQKKYQRLFLVAICDGDSAGVLRRKSDFDEALTDDGLIRRQNDERIANPVPTWSIETWLLALLDDYTLDEAASRKLDFENRYPGKHEGTALRDAARAWHNRVDHVASVPSLLDGKKEMSRLDLP